MVKNKIVSYYGINQNGKIGLLLWDGRNINLNTGWTRNSDPWLHTLPFYQLDQLQI